jgi:hypothetical protein
LEKGDFYGLLAISELFSWLKNYQGTGYFPLQGFEESPGSFPGERKWARKDSSRG